MACSSCGARTTISPNRAPTLTPEQAAARLAPNGEATLVQYTGDKMGNVAYKGQGGNFYVFSFGEPPKYVLAVDLPMFEGRDDFVIMPKEVKPTASDTAVEPVLVAAGRPE